MKENKNNEVVKYLLENYDIKNANDITYALKDMFKDTIQTMMNAKFEPQIFPKNKREISGIEGKVINLYGKGLSTREISDFIEDIYGVQLSATMISNITDTVLEEIEEWQKRPSKEVYSIVFIDAVHFNVKQKNVIVKKAAYVILGVTTEGFKEVLGIWIRENESAKYWLGTFKRIKEPWC